MVRSLSEQLDQLFHDSQNRRLAAGLLPESSDLDEELLPARALEQAAACHLRRARLFWDGATCPPPRLQVAVRRKPEPFSLPLYSLLPTSPSDPHCAMRAKGHQTSRREAGKNDITLQPQGKCLYTTEHRHTLGTSSDQSLLSPA